MIPDDLHVLPASTARVIDTVHYMILTDISGAWSYATCYTFYRKFTYEHVFLFWAVIPLFCPISDTGLICLTRRENVFSISIFSMVH